MRGEGCHWEGGRQNAAKHKLVMKLKSTIAGTFQPEADGAGAAVCHDGDAVRAPLGVYGQQLHLEGLQGEGG